MREILAIKAVGESARAGNFLEIFIGGFHSHIAIGFAGGTPFDSGVGFDVGADNHLLVEVIGLGIPEKLESEGLGHRSIAALEVAGDVGESGLPSLSIFKLKSGILIYIYVFNKLEWELTFLTMPLQQSKQTR